MQLHLTTSTSIIAVCIHPSLLIHPSLNTISCHTLLLLPLTSHSLHPPVIALSNIDEAGIVHHTSWHTPLNSTVHHVDAPDMTSLRLLPLARPRTGISPTVSSSLHLIAVLLFLALRLRIFPMPLIFLFLL